jgi:hypothetical protein
VAVVKFASEDEAGRTISKLEGKQLGGEAGKELKL